MTAELLCHPCIAAHDTVFRADQRSPPGGRTLRPRSYRALQIPTTKSRKRLTIFTAAVSKCHVSQSIEEAVDCVTQPADCWSALSQDQVKALAVLVSLGLLMPDAAQAFTIHQEPKNALSFPTWVIHISSVIEWVVAMALVWRYAEVTGAVSP